MQNEKTSVLVLAQCDLTMRETLNTRFGTQCAFTFAENGEHPTAEQLRAAAVIFGEPSEAQLAQTEKDVYKRQRLRTGFESISRMTARIVSAVTSLSCCVRRVSRRSLQKALDVYKRQPLGKIQGYSASSRTAAIAVSTSFSVLKYISFGFKRK